MKFTNLKNNESNKYIEVAVKVYKSILFELKDVPAGEYFINEGFRLLVQQYKTKVFNDDAQIEWHKKNHDVFISLNGEENAMGVEGGAKNFGENYGFSDEKDIGFTSVIPYKSVAPLRKFDKENNIMHFEPMDLHISQLAIDGKPTKAKKCCFKIVDGHECKVSDMEIENLRSLLNKKIKEKEEMLKFMFHMPLEY